MKQRILVVDDEPAILELVSYNLKRDGYEVITAADGKSALEMFMNEKPDLVILDLMIPEPDGYEVCKRIRAQSAVPVIMLTARGEEQDRIRGLDLGADDYVVKPLQSQGVASPGARRAAPLANGARRRSSGRRGSGHRQ